MKKTEIDRMIENGYEPDRWATREALVAEMEDVKNKCRWGLGVYSKSSVRWKGYKHLTALGKALAKWVKLGK